MRTLQEWLGHRDFKTTLIYADYSPSPIEGELVERAFADPSVHSSVQSERNSADLTERDTCLREPNRPQAVTRTRNC